MSHLYPNGPSTECPRSVTTVTYAYRVVGMLRDDKQRRNRCYRKSNCKSFSLGKSRSSEQNRNQWKFRIQEINSLVFFVTLIFFFSFEPPAFYFTWHEHGNSRSSTWIATAHAAHSGEANEISNYEVMWPLDSGCTDHIINNVNYFDKSIDLKVPVNICRIEVRIMEMGV